MPSPAAPEDTVCHYSGSLKRASANMSSKKNLVGKASQTGTKRKGAQEGKRRGRPPKLAKSMSF
jgi:hypothetical protein